MIIQDIEGHQAMANTPSKPAPLETDPDEQKDDNIDAFGRKADGSKQEQPTKPKPPLLPAQTSVRTRSTMLG